MAEESREQLEAMNRELSHIESYAHLARDEVLECLDLLDDIESGELPDEEQEVSELLLTQHIEQAEEYVNEIPGAEL